MRRLRPSLLATGVVVAIVVAVVPSLSNASSRPRSTAAWSPVKGVAVLVNDADAISDARSMVIANELFSTISRRLHANAVSLNFPFAQSSSSSDDPGPGPMTPTPARLGALTAVAHRYGLQVQYRPYLYQGDLYDQARTLIDPQDPSAWFGNYWAFLRPYLVSANEAGATSFSVGLELTTLLPSLSSWEDLVSQSRSLFSGSILYSQQHLPLVSIPLTTHGYDDYEPVLLPNDRFATVGRLSRGFDRNLTMAGMQSTPQDTTIEELGIAAVPGAYDQPNAEVFAPGTPIDRPIQEAWFEAACDAFWALHLRGIYFWAIGFNSFTPNEDNATSALAWYGTPTQSVVASCFARHR
jgi:hypothetical protein